MSKRLSMFVSVRTYNKLLQLSGKYNIDMKHISSVVNRAVEEQAIRLTLSQFKEQPKEEHFTRIHLYLLNDIYNGIQYLAKQTGLSEKEIILNCIEHAKLDKPQEDEF